MSYANVTRLPAQRVPLVDEKMPGLVSRDWYRFFQRLFELTGAGSDATTISDLEVNTANNATSELAEINNAIQSLNLKPVQSEDVFNIQINNINQDFQTGPVDSASQLIAEVVSAIQSLQTGPVDSASQLIAEVVSAIQSLQLKPEPVPVSNFLRYGSFYSDANQTAAVINTAYSIAFPNVSFSKGVYQPVANTQIVVDRDGLYLFETTLQLNLTGTNSLVSLWAAKNGTNIANSGSQHVIMSSNIDALLLESSSISNADEKNGVSRTFMLPLTANDYVEFKWATSSTSVVLTATAASSPVPAIPSASLNVYRVGDL
jgi:L-fucose mutarotase/ribose pyranase (RbsD/FucU family)